MTRQTKSRRWLSRGALLPCLALAACSTGDYRLFHPLNLISATEWNSTLLEVGIMLLVILPVTALIAIFIWRYRKGANAAYDPEWAHSTVLELLVWGVPFAIVAVLGVISFRTMYDVDPYAPHDLASEEAAPGGTPLHVDIITTDWQWVFIYPAQHIATVDELIVPQGAVVQARLTSTSVTNDFFIPQLASMIDVMPGMRTVNTFDTPKLGDYTGFSADFSGAGFSWMQFVTHVVSPADFTAWVSTAQASPKRLDYAAFQKLAQPTANIGAKVSQFSNADPQLFEKVVAAAQAGVVYPVSDTLTKSIAFNQPGGVTNPQTK